MQDYVFFVTPVTRARTGGWQFSVASLQMQIHGPFPSASAAHRFKRDLEARWRRRAAALGGSMRCAPEQWIVTLPDEAPVVGLRWAPEPALPVRKGPDPRDDPPLRLRGGPYKVF